VAEVRVLDITSLQADPPKKYKKFRRVGPRGGVLRAARPGGTAVRRNPASVIGITMHQTACTFGATRSAIRAAGGDVDTARHMRALGVPYHVLAFRDGCAVHAVPLSWHSYHGNGLNRFTLGCAVEGKYHGRRKPGRDELTRETYRATCQALRYLVREGRRLGMPIEYIYAHRQSSGNRRSDPGEEIWRRCVIGYAVRKLGLRTNLGFVTGSGRTIPPQWDAAGMGEF